VNQDHIRASVGLRVARLDGAVRCLGPVEWNLIGAAPRECQAEYRWDLVLVHHQTGGAAITYEDATGALHPDEEGAPNGDHPVCACICCFRRIQETAGDRAGRAFGGSGGRPCRPAAMMPGEVRLSDRLGLRGRS